MARPTRFGSAPIGFGGWESSARSSAPLFFPSLWAFGRQRGLLGPGGFWRQDKGSQVLGQRALPDSLEFVLGAVVEAL